MQTFFKAFGAMVVAVSASAALAHPDHDEPGLLSHWAAGAHEVQNGKLDDVTHTHTATVVGDPGVTAVGPTLAAVFDGVDDYLLIAKDAAPGMKGLPKQTFTASAWVNLASTQQYGSILGLIQDNGGFEKGWHLGYNESTFTFALASVGADDGDGKMTYLRGKTPIAVGRWYHVAATYDGKTMRLYVNGALDAESKEQSGDILYPPKAPYTLACYLDDDERFPLHGAVHRVKLYDRVLPESEFRSVVEKNANLVAYVPPAEKELRWLVEPYLQAATLSSMVVMSETNRPSGMVVEYGPSQPLSYRAQIPEPKALGEVKLDNLEPNTRYFYRVLRDDGNGATLASPIRAMKTAVPPEMPYSFGIIGDTQRNPEVTRKCAEVAFAMRPDFMLHCGDVVDDGFAKNQWLKDLFEPMKGLLAHTPIFPVIGNHEGNSHFYYDYFSLPDPEYYYTFTFGNAQFFMIDSNKDLSPDGEQYKRLERDLAASKAVWKFAAHHHPCFSSDNDDYGDTQTGQADKPMTWGDSNARKLVPLYEKYGVDIVFNGHIHSYERTWPILNMTINQKKGVRYIVSGGGGGGLETAAPNKAWFSVHVNRAHHICYVTIHDRTIQLKAYDIDGRLFDTFEFTKPADR